jgi:hypothetical protein
MSLNYSDAAFHFAPWSLSKAHTAIHCPFKFKLQYIERLKIKGIPRARSTMLGIATHEALEWVLRGKHSLQEALRRAAIKAELTSVEMDDLFALSHNIEQFLQRLDKFKESRNVTEQLVEYRFALTKDLKPAEYWGKDVFVRGVWDLCLRAQEKYLIIIDHKTGYVGGVDAHKDQLRLYAIAGLHTFDNVCGVQSALNYIQDDTGVAWDDMHSAQYIEETLTPWFVDFINQAAEATREAKAKRGFWCSYCEYTEQCPLGQTKVSSGQEKP